MAQRAETPNSYMQPTMQTDNLPVFDLRLPTDEPFHGITLAFTALLDGPGYRLRVQIGRAHV